MTRKFNETLTYLDQIKFQLDKEKDIPTQGRVSDLKNYGSIKRSQASKESLPIHSAQFEKNNRNSD